MLLRTFVAAVAVAPAACALQLAAASSAADCSIRDHGAAGDNKTEDTAALAAALAACARGGGGGAVVVPAGTYLIRPVELPSYTSLVLQPGSTLAAWPDRYTWPNSTNKPCDFAHEGSSCCLNSALISLLCS